VGVIVNWQIILLAWALIHAPIALGIGRAFKKSSFAGGFKHPVSETVASHRPPADREATDNSAEFA
jgi:hypothetical protein